MALALRDLDAADVAADVVEAVAAHLGRLAFGLGPAIEVRVLDQTGAKPASLVNARATAASTTIGLTVADLTRYAQTGDTGDWGGPEGALDALLEVCGALYGCAGQPGTMGAGALDVLDETDEDSPIGLVLLAAHGRCQVGLGRPVSLRELAALSGLSARMLRHLVQQGELAASDERPARVAAADARRWLANRGVAGFRTAKA
jgi:hypothetical protein